jgi:hypothetical protein
LQGRYYKLFAGRPGPRAVVIGELLCDSPEGPQEAGVIPLVPPARKKRKAEGQGEKARAAGTAQFLRSRPFPLGLDPR